MFTEIPFDTANQMHAERIREADRHRMAKQAQRDARMRDTGFRPANIGETVMMIVGLWGRDATQAVRG
jgi:hypothetical protein